MKRYIYSLIAITVVFSACKKDVINKSTNNGKQTSVTFNVGFAQSVGSFNGARSLAKFTGHSLAADSTLKANASILYATVYQANGSNLIQTKQLSTDTAFGHITFSLPAGTYTVAFAAGQAGLFMDNSSLSTAELVYSRGQNGIDNSWHSTFFQKITITVGSTGIVQNVSLSRIDSQIVIDIEDAIPSNVKFLTVTSTDNKSEGGKDLPLFSVATGAPIASSNDGFKFADTSPDTAVTTGVKNTRFCITLLDTSNPYKVTIYAYDQLPPANFAGQGFNGTLIGFFTSSTVTVQTGHQTILSGKLFGGNGLTNSGGFQMTVDPTWDPTTTTIPFQ